MPGQIYNTESGFVNQALLFGAGVADNGTRLVLQINNVPSGVNVYAAVMSDDGVSAQMTATDSNGVGSEGAFVTGSNMFGGKFAPVTITNGAGTAVWEVVSASAPARLNFVVVVTGMTQAGLGPISLAGTLGPLSAAETATATDPLPRFASNSLTGFVDMTLLTPSTTQGSCNSLQAAAASLPASVLAAIYPQGVPKTVTAHSANSNPNNIQGGTNVSMNYNLQNNSTGGTSTVSMDSNLSSALTNVQCSATGGTCNVTQNPDGSSNVSASASGLPSGGTAPVSITATVCSSCDGAVVSVDTTVSAQNANGQVVGDSYPDDNILSNTTLTVGSPSTLVSVSFGGTCPLNVVPQLVAQSPLLIAPGGLMPTFSAPATQAGPVAGTQCLFTNWNEDGSNLPSRSNVPAPLGGGTFTANYIAQYQLNVTPSPQAGGTVTPASGSNFFASGAIVQIDETPNPGYVFTGYTGDTSYLSQSTPGQVVMPLNGIDITANFVPVTISAGAVTPASGAGLNQVFTFTLTDSQGSSDLSLAEVLFNANTALPSSCYVAVTPSTGAVLLAANNGATPLQSTLGTTGVLQNSQCTLNVAASSGAWQGNNYMLTLSLSFQTAFAGSKNVYSYVGSSSGINSGLQQVGTWIVPSSASPVLTSISPNRTSQTAATSGTIALTLTGSSFESGASILWTGPSQAQTKLATAFVSSTQLTAAIPMSDFATAGIAQVAVLNPDLGLSSAQPFAITATGGSAPVLTSVTPNPVLKSSGTGTTTLTAAGSNFSSGASLWWTAPTGATVSLPASFVNASQLQASVPGSLLTTPGTAQISCIERRLWDLRLADISHYQQRSECSILVRFALFGKRIFAVIQLPILRWRGRYRLIHCFRPL